MEVQTITAVLDATTNTATVIQTTAHNLPLARLRLTMDNVEERTSCLALDRIQAHAVVNTGGGKFSKTVDRYMLIRHLPVVHRPTIAAKAATRFMAIVRQ